MSLPTARDKSNAPDGKGDTKPSTGDLAMVGFTHVPYEKERPAQSNQDISSTKDSIGGSVLGNDGTSRGAYAFQPDKLPSDKPSGADWGYDDPDTKKISKKGDPND